MKKKVLLNGFCLILLLFSGVFFVSCKENYKPVNKISNIAISEEFFTTPIYQNQYVDLSNYNITITNTIYDNETYSLDDILTNGLDTKITGLHSFIITYKDFSKEFTYNVLPVSMIDAMYVGTTVLYYKHEGPDLANQRFSVLYSNGSEKRFNLSDASINFEDLTFSLTEKTIMATYGEIKFKVPYKVVTREIIFNQEYNLIDKTNKFNDCKIIFSNNQFSIYTSNENIIDKKLSGKISQTEIPNEYQSKVLVDKKLTSYIFYLTANGIVMESI